MLEAVVANGTAWRMRGEVPRSLKIAHHFNLEDQGMTKSMEVITEAVRNTKHPFPKVDNQPKKPQKHRYERRKIKEYLHLGEWTAGESS